MPNPSMVRTAEDLTDQSDSAQATGPAAPESLPAAASTEDSRLYQAAQGAGADPDSQWLLERFLEKGVPDLLSLPVQPQASGATLLGFEDAAKALAALLELDLSTLLTLVPTELQPVPAEPVRLDRQSDLGWSIGVETTVGYLSLTPRAASTVDNATTPTELRDLIEVPIEPSPVIWFHPQSVTVGAANTSFGPGAVSDGDGSADGVAEDATNGTAVGLTAQGSDPDGDPVTYSLSNNAGGRFAIDPNSGVVTVANASLLDFEANSNHSITVVATSTGGTSSQSFTIAVTDVAEPPVAADDIANTDEDAAVTGNVLSNDTGGVGPLTVSVASGPVSGAPTLNADGSFAYTPDANFTGSDSFTYMVTDSLGATDTGVVTLTVAPLGTDVFGTSGADTISGTAARENIYGLNGSDDILAGGGNDYVDGGNGKDDIYGEDGDDWLVSGTGPDQLFGGNGNDILDASSGGNSVVYGDAGDDTLIWSAALKTADGGTGTDTLRANSGNVNLTGSSGTVVSIEAVDLSRGSGASTVKLSAQDVLDISDTDVLTILGTEADSVDAGTGWTDGGVAGGLHTYTKTVGGSLATLVVDVDVSTNPDILV